MNSIKADSKELKNKKTLDLINGLFDPYKINSVPGIKRTFTVKDHKANLKLLTSILARLKSKDADLSQSTDSVKKEPPLIVKTEIKREIVPIKKEVIEVQSVNEEEDDDEVIDINAI